MNIDLVDNVRIESGPLFLNVPGDIPDDYVRVRIGKKYVPTLEELELLKGKITSWTCYNEFSYFGSSALPSGQFIDFSSIIGKKEYMIFEYKGEKYHINLNTLVVDVRNRNLDDLFNLWEI